MVSKRGYSFLRFRVRDLESFNIASLMALAASRAGLRARNAPRSWLFIVFMILTAVIIG